MAHAGRVAEMAGVEGHHQRFQEPPSTLLVSVTLGPTLELTRCTILFKGKVASQTQQLSI